MDPGVAQPRVAEFFAGIGLVRMALEQVGFRVVFANDISPAKRRLYAANFDAADYRLADVRAIRGGDVPDIEMATASFPCTDVSLSGNRGNIHGEQSGLFWEFVRILEAMDDRRPRVILLENVAGLTSSGQGEDLRQAIAALNRLGYWCDPFQVDARWFVPQSRPRLFIVGVVEPEDGPLVSTARERWVVRVSGDLRPAWLLMFAARYPRLMLRSFPLDRPAPTDATLADTVERLAPEDERWWDAARLERFVASLSPTNAARLANLRCQPLPSWRTAYRRTRNGTPMWEIRADRISGCLRTARGGSSKQAVIEAGAGDVRARWMTPREYARLQGAPDYRFADATPGQVYSGFGDAVCVPVIAWIARHCLVPLLRAGESAVKEEHVAFA